MVTVKEQLKILQEAQELTVCAYASLCKPKKTSQKKNKSVPQPRELMIVEEQPASPSSTTEDRASSDTNGNDNGEDENDILRLAEVQ